MTELTIGRRQVFDISIPMFPLGGYPYLASDIALRIRSTTGDRNKKKIRTSTVTLGKIDTPQKRNSVGNTL